MNASRVVGPGGYEYTAYPIKRCDRCQRDTRHSTNGRCLELHRKTPLRASKRPRSDKDPWATARWNAVRLRVFDRDDYRCQRCGFGAGSAVLDAHHRTLRGRGGSSDDALVYGLANLITLCRFGCHDFVHNNRDDAERLGYIIPRFPGDDPESVPVLTIHGWVYLLSDGTRIPASEATNG